MSALCRDQVVKSLLNARSARRGFVSAKIPSRERERERMHDGMKSGRQMECRPQRMQGADE